MTLCCGLKTPLLQTMPLTMATPQELTNPPGEKQRENFPTGVQEFQSRHLH